MAFFVILVLMLIATGIMESGWIERREEKAEINRLADRSLKKPAPSIRKRCRYSRVYNPMLKMEVRRK